MVLLPTLGLLFALAPLRRAAERVASAAVPGARAPEELGRDEAAALYRDQVRLAWADGTLGKASARCWPSSASGSG